MEKDKEEIINELKTQFGYINSIKETSEQYFDLLESIANCLAEKEPDRKIALGALAGIFSIVSIDLLEKDNSKETRALIRNLYENIKTSISAIHGQALFDEDLDNKLNEE